MDNTIVHLVFGALGAAFLTGTVIIIRNVIRINRLNDAWKRRINDNTIALIFPNQKLQNKLLPMITTQQTLHILLPKHKMTMINNKAV